jgi:hypothetical protein
MRLDATGRGGRTADAAGAVLLRGGTARPWYGPPGAGSRFAGIRVAAAREAVDPRVAAGYRRPGGLETCRGNRI